MANGTGVRRCGVVVALALLAAACGSAGRPTKVVEARDVPRQSAGSRAAPATELRIEHESLSREASHAPESAPGDASDHAGAIAAMRRAIVLYEQFIERAHGDPDMQVAVERSRERIEELRQTIAVLETW